MFLKIVMHTNKLYFVFIVCNISSIYIVFRFLVVMIAQHIENANLTSYVCLHCIL